MEWRQVIRMTFWAVAGWIMAASVAVAADAGHATPNVAAASDTGASLRKKREWIADRISQFEAAAHKQAAKPGSNADAQALDSLRAINSVYLEHQNQLEQRSRLEART